MSSWISRVGGMLNVTPCSQLLLSVSGKRVPTARMTSASRARRFAGGEPQKPIMPSSCGWSGGSTPVPISVWATGSPASSARRRTAAVARRVPPPARSSGRCRIAQLVSDRARRGLSEGGRLHRRSGDDLRIEGLGQDVHGQRDQNRAGPAGDRDVPRPRQDARHLVCPADPPGALDEGLVHRDLVRVATQVELLVRAATLEVGRDVAGQDEHRDRVERGGRHARGGVRHPRADMEDHDAGPSRGAGIAVRGVRRDLLVPRGDEAWASVALEGREEGDVGVAAESESQLHAPVDQESGDVVGNRGSHATSVRGSGMTGRRGNRCFPNIGLSSPV